MLYIPVMARYMCGLKVTQRPLSDGIEVDSEAVPFNFQIKKYLFENNNNNDKNKNKYNL